MTKNYLLLLFFSLFIFLPSEAQNCNPPTALSVANVTATTATISWVSSGNATQWEVLVLPSGAPAPTISTVGMVSTTSLFTVNGLVSCTLYDFYVRAVCEPTVMSNWTPAAHFSTMSALICNTTVNGNSITTMVLGGTAPYQYTINGGPSMVSISGVFTVSVNLGVFVVQVIDANGCSCMTTVTVTNTGGFSVTVSPSLDVPVSSLNATVVTAIGTGPFGYQWSLNGMPISGATSSSLNVLGLSGVFSVTATDLVTGFTATDTFVLEPIPVANDDIMTIYQTDSNVSNSGSSVFSNDYLGSSVSMPPVTVLTIPPGFVFNPDGSVSVLTGTPPGVYTLVYQLCSSFSPTSCDTATAIITVINEGISMNAFIDSNNNGAQDSGEPAFSQGQFGYELNDSGTVNYVTSSNGEYVINESNPANSYDLTYTIDPAVSSQYALTTSSYTNVSIIPNSGIQVYNFPITELPYHDLTVAVVPAGASPRPGFTYYNMIVYRNNGNQAIASGTVTFNKDNAVTIVNVSPAATTTNTTGFTYDFTNLLPGEVRSLYVLMQVPTIPTVDLGGILTNNASITIPVGDINVSNNTSTLSQIIVGSYDPNDKSEAHGGKIVHSGFTANDYLTYTIQFENTGTFAAENVSIEDSLDEKLDETSVKMTGASHGYTLNRVGNNLHWSFIGIDLPPSVANTTAGKGYVTFQVKPKADYAVGDIIPNIASIYFDFNPPIVTNTSNTEFVTSLGVAEFDNAAFIAYPNPASNSITVSLKNTGKIIDTVTVNDILGKIMQSDVIHNTTAVIDLSKLSQGIYFLKIQSEGQERVMKVVKQ
ncbi:DUF7619 domain-containing protein [Flavobacterium sp.]|uniref:DUF7619 domain-containing protein n=1 Tax=Flavobacterium sp. TaxID=239 RepID=UPI003D6AF8AC